MKKKMHAAKWDRKQKQEGKKKEQVCLRNIEINVLRENDFVK